MTSITFEQPHVESYTCLESNVGPRWCNFDSPNVYPIRVVLNVGIEIRVCLTRLSNFQKTVFLLCPERELIHNCPERRILDV